MKRFFTFCLTILLVGGGLILAEPHKPVPAKPLPAYAEEIEFDEADFEENELLDAEETGRENLLGLRDKVVYPIEYYSDQVKLCVKGKASKTIKPDYMEVNGQICGMGDDLTKAKDNAFSSFDNAVNFLTGKGCDKDKIVINSLYSYPCRDCHMKGYHVSLNFSFDVDDLSLSKDILSSLLDENVDEICSVRYKAKNIEDEYNSLLTEALENAKAKASKLLSTQPELINITEESVYYSDCLYRDYLGMDGYVGEIEIEAMVEATFM